jgi:hypothetical protein
MKSQTLAQDIARFRDYSAEFSPRPWHFYNISQLISCPRLWAEFLRASYRRKTQERNDGEAGDVDEGPLSMGQDAGLIHDIPRAADIVIRIAREAEEILTRKLPALVTAAP